ncbi:PepSY-associated TM helix domain-containing protein [Undibacterium luofuense]|uniref:PepSY-associated TM helix domain-containing protein n=1 Tax=Undibacterium luofuense TaxID=2828733 RepID=UPI003C70170E
MQASSSRNQPQQRAFWLRQLHQWHWISSAICLVAMLVFAITGFTLNHAAQIEAHPVVSQKEAQLPADLLKALQKARDDEANAVPPQVSAWLNSEMGIRDPGQAPEWSPEEVYVAMPRPGGDAWLRVSLEDGHAEYELTDRGWISFLNDLHKGRNTGAVWNWLIDIFALACLIFSITGLLLLKMHAANRRSTWPLVAGGLVIPLLCILLFIH